MWSVGTILTGLLSFMNETAHTTGSISSTKAEKRRFAKMSLEYNLKNPMFRKLFPEYLEEFRRRQLEEEVGYHILMQHTCKTSQRWQHQDLSCMLSCLCGAGQYLRSAWMEEILQKQLMHCCLCRLHAGVFTSHQCCCCRLWHIAAVCMTPHQAAAQRMLCCQESVKGIASTQHMIAGTGQAE